MKFSRQFAVVAVLSFQLLGAFADEVITNFTSSIVSYQFNDDLSGATLTNGGLQSRVMSFQFLQDFNNAALTDGGVISRMASYQYLVEFSAGVLTNGGVFSPLVSFQYYEWPGDGIFNLQSSLPVSYFWQSGTQVGANSFHGTVSDNTGKPLSGATVSAMVMLTPTAQAVTDASGYYQMVSLPSGVYDLWATESTHQTSIRAVTLNTGTRGQDFQLNPLPLTPAMQHANRQPALTYTFGLMSSQLKIFDGVNFVPITLANMPLQNTMTIVLTHGWVQGTPNASIMDAPFNLWPVEMASKIRASGVGPDVANIVAWDWRYAATDPPPFPSDASDRTTDQGIGLGHAMFQTFGANYTEPIHFVGHSLGTLVNAAAANYLHQDRTGTGRQDVAPNKWPYLQTHMTLFDQAQVAEIAGKQVLFDGLDPSALDAWNGAVGNNPPQIWQAPLPVHFKWADNYISVVGKTLSGAVNIFLQKGQVSQGPIDAHGYPIQWYIDSITRPNVSLLGFHRSYEHGRAFDISDAAFPPVGIAVDDVYHQSIHASDQLILEFYSANTFQPLGIFPQAVLQGLTDFGTYAGNVAVQIGDRIVAGAQKTQQQISQGFNYVSGVATQGGQALVNFSDSAMLQILLISAPATVSSPDNANFPRLPSWEPKANPGSNAPAMAWLPVAINSGSVAMAFDFTVSGDPVDDALVFGIGASNLFSLQAKYIPTNFLSSSRLIDISQWAGTTNELFFGLLGGTSTNATLQIQNVRFYSLQPPKLSFASSNAPALLLWPSTGNGYVVESAPWLASPVWETATNAPVISMDNYILTNYWTDPTRFFRLRQQ
jgi:hypothetical protein